ncbi:18113_t:CDS:2, partial [Racocetra persica]
QMSSIKYLVIRDEEKESQGNDINDRKINANEYLGGVNNYESEIFTASSATDLVTTGIDSDSLVGFVNTEGQGNKFITTPFDITIDITKFLRYFLNNDEDFLSYPYYFKNYNFLVVWNVSSKEAQNQDAQNQDIQNQDAQNQDNQNHSTQNQNQNAKLYGYLLIIFCFWNNNNHSTLDDIKKATVRALEEP